MLTHVIIDLLKSFHLMFLKPERYNLFHESFLRPSYDIKKKGNVVFIKGPGSSKHLLQKKNKNDQDFIMHFRSKLV